MQHAGRETFAPSLEEGTWQVDMSSIRIQIPFEMEIGQDTSMQLCASQGMTQGNGGQT